MSLHLTNNVKEPTTKEGQPFFLETGSEGGRPVHVGDRLAQRRKGAVPSGEAAYMDGIPNRQTLFAILFQKFLGVGR